MSATGERDKPVGTDALVEKFSGPECQGIEAKVRKAKAQKTSAQNAKARRR